MAQDVGMVYMCCGVVCVEGSITTCACFHSENFFCDFLYYAVTQDACRLTVEGPFVIF